MRKAAGVCILFLFTCMSGAAAQCPTHWIRFGNSCYAFLDDVVPWINAEVTCRALFEARMLEVETQDENDFITGEMHVKGLTSVWLGINDKLKEGEWVYNSDQQNATFLLWETGEPGSSTDHENGAGEDCVAIASNGRWHDLWCEDIYNSGWSPATVCEMEFEEPEIVG